MKQDIENIIKKFDDIYLDKNSVSGLNQKDFKSFPDIVKHIRTNFIPLIADEVLKVVVENITKFATYNYHNGERYIEFKEENLLSNLSPNKENKNNG
jgi:hypothetical protein